MDRRANTAQGDILVLPLDSNISIHSSIFDFVDFDFRSSAYRDRQSAIIIVILASSSLIGVICSEYLYSRKNSFNYSPMTCK